MRYFLELNYNGRAYFGWQVQPGNDSVQGRLEEQLSVLLNRPTGVTGCGRTDSGVHAARYFAHFDAEEPLPDNFLLRLNKLLPGDIGVQAMHPVPDTAHARFDALSRTYKYHIHFRKDAFLQGRSYWLHSYRLNLDDMNSSAAALLDYRDFRTFQKKGGDAKTSLCKVMYAEWQVVDANRWCFTITADRFLRNMVRRITGALLMTGIGRLDLEDVRQALATRSALEVNIAPPAHGLYLCDITYPQSVLRTEQDI